MTQTASSLAAPGSVSCDAITQLFNTIFATENTILQGGADEPYFRPAGVFTPAVIHFRADYLRSALHEVAHWCVAGKARRLLDDYGYWYSPDDRDAVEQAAFFAVEARPQALESLFCDALGLTFSPSIDNFTLTIGAEPRADFEQRIATARGNYTNNGLPPRAGTFLKLLTTLPK